MNQPLSWDLTRLAAVKRVPHEHDSQISSAPPKALTDRVARQVGNGSLEIILEVVEQASLPLVVESNYPGADWRYSGEVSRIDLSFNGGILQANNARLPFPSGQVDTTWIVTYPSLNEEKHALELFNTNGRRLLKISAETDNNICWSQLLDALPLGVGL